MNFRGFISLGLILAIVIGAAILGTAAWYASEHPSLVATSTPLSFGAVNTAYTGPNAGCYSKKGDAVYWSGDHLAVASGDAATFQDLTVYGICFGKDKNHAYRDGIALAGVDPGHFKLLYYLKGARTILFQNGTGIIAFHYGSDNDSDYQSEELIQNGDAATFTELKTIFQISQFAKDKNNVYCDGKVLPGADPATAVSDGQDLTVSVGGQTEVYHYDCQVVTAENNGMQTYANVEYGFILDYPPTMQVGSPQDAIEWNSSPAPVVVLLSSPGTVMVGASSAPDAVAACTAGEAERVFIHGVEFNKYEGQGPALSQIGLYHLYTALHNGSCYKIETSFMGAATSHMSSQSDIAAERSFEAQTFAKLDAVAESLQFTE